MNVASFNSDLTLYHTSKLVYQCNVSLHAIIVSSNYLKVTKSEAIYMIYNINIHNMTPEGTFRPLGFDLPFCKTKRTNHIYSFISIWLMFEHRNELERYKCPYLTHISIYHIIISHITYQFMVTFQF